MRPSSYAMQRQHEQILRFLLARDFNIVGKLDDKGRLLEAIDFVLELIERKEEASTTHALETRLAHVIEERALLLVQKQDEQLKLDAYELLKKV